MVTPEVADYTTLGQLYAIIEEQPVVPSTEPGSSSSSSSVASECSRIKILRVPHGEVAKQFLLFCAFDGMRIVEHHKMKNYKSRLLSNGTKP